MELVVSSPDDGGGGISTFYNQFSIGKMDQIKHTLLFASPFKYTDSNRLLWNKLPSSLQLPLAAAESGFADANRRTLDILEVCDWPLNCAPAIVQQEVPYVVQCHGSMGQLAEHDPQSGTELAEILVQLIEPQLLRAAHRVQTYSLSNKLFWECKTGRSVDLIRPAFELPSLPRELTLCPVGRVFGRLQPWKGPHILCEALQRLGSKAPVVEWYGATKPWGASGTPADIQLAEDYPKAWGETFRHKLPLPRHQVFALQASALFNVVPSTWDVFNFTAVESMAAARPTIVSSGAGASELIIDGQNGFVFQNGDAEGLADVIDRILTMTEMERREIGRAGRETIAVELEPTKIMQLRCEAYNEAIRSFHSDPPRKPDDWLISLLTPSRSGTLNYDALLDPVPLRSIGGHIVKRILDKGLSRWL